MKKKYVFLVAAVVGVLCVLYTQTSLFRSVADAANVLPEGTVIDSLLVIKSKRELHAFAHGVRLKVYPIALGKQPVGRKRFEGDNRTPEGLYVINDKNPNSDYHKNLGISYPNAFDADSAESKGLSPGGDVKIHGLRNGIGMIGRMHRVTDWTAGCIAVTNEEIDELFRTVKVGSPICIKP